MSTSNLQSNNLGRKQIDSVSFSVSARVAMQLGRESISSSVTAILELVKNAYDADAERIRIRFATTRSRRMLIIEDDGEGMDVQALLSKWMVIGTSNKVTARESSHRKRIKAGEKGLGRLGLDRLCGCTRVQSHMEGAAEAVELKINWAKYEASTARLETVKHDVYSIPNLSRDPVSKKEVDYPHGTRLILMGLKDRWDKEQLAELHQELSFLVSPFGDVQDFLIELDTEGVAPHLDGLVQSPDELLDQAYWKVRATIDAEAKVTISMTSAQRTEAYQLAPTAWEDFVKDCGDVPKCGALSFDLYFFHRGGPEDGHDFSRSAISTFLDNNQGVRIYRDGFRVKPYGEPNGEGDWLRLAYRRMQSPGAVSSPGWKVGYNQVCGAVFLTRAGNSELVDQTNREGLVLGDAFKHLVAFGQRTVRFFEASQRAFEKRKAKTPSTDVPPEDKAKANSEAAANALAGLSLLSENLSRQAPTSGSNSQVESPSGTVAISPTDVESVRATLSSVVAEFERTIREKDALIEKQESEKNTMANLASLGILATCFGHDTIAWTGVVSTNANLLHLGLKSKLWMVVPDVEEEVLGQLADLYTESQKIETFGRFALGNIQPVKRRRKAVCVKEVAGQVLKMFKSTFQDEKNIDVDFSQVPDGRCEISAYRIDWESIFANLIANAAWAMGKKGKDDRRIRLAIFEEAEIYRVVFEDSGFGLEVGTEEQIFEAAFSTRRNYRGEQEGTGMGLFIVKSFVVDNSKGKIQAFAKGDLGGAKFVIEVPRLHAEGPKERA